jgi:uncharacterized spore protein YtfJ
MARMGENLSVGRAFGPPYESGGALVVPVALVAGGGGGGEAPRSADDGDPGASRPSGGGFGGVVAPLGAYVVRDGEARWVPAVNPTVIVLAVVLLTRMVLRALARRR